MAKIGSRSGDPTEQRQTAAPGYGPRAAKVAPCGFSDGGRALRGSPRCLRRRSSLASGEIRVGHVETDGNGRVRVRVGAFSAEIVQALRTLTDE
jgi:hypothetical protein